jgi:hypothetical protein
LGFALGGVATARGALAPLTAWLTDPGASVRVEPSLAALVGLPSWLAALIGVGVVAVLLWRFPPAVREPGRWPWPATGSALGLLGVLAWVTGAHAGWNWGLSITGPSRSLLEAALFGSADALNWGTAMLVGIPLGTWLSARLRGPVAWRAPVPSELPRRFLGGLLMGGGGTLAAGCNIGNALTGLSVLAVHSLIATAGIAAGGALAARILDGSTRQD